MDWGAVFIGAISGGVAAVAAVAALRTDVRWLKEQVRDLWKAVNGIRVPPELRAP